jgi:hypothetical protein
MPLALVLHENKKLVVEEVDVSRGIFHWMNEEWFVSYFFSFLNMDPKTFSSK